jgi:hypothetical protein
MFVAHRLLCLPISLGCGRRLFRIEEKQQNAP